MSVEETYLQVLRYHNQTKHSFQQSARSLGYMDWANQPVPYRLYKGSPIIKLPLSCSDPDCSHLDLFSRDNNQPQAYTIENVAKLIELSLGLSSWKQAGDSRWALRMNPSSGNLHPTESYWILPAMEGVKNGLYHYSPLIHALQKLHTYPPEVDDLWEKPEQPKGYFVAFSSIFWREAWKYGERAYRYCQLDIGHALAGLSLAANLLGWRVILDESISDHDLERLLGFDYIPWLPMENDEVECLCRVQISNNGLDDRDAGKLLTLSAFSQLATPEPLSANHYHWEAIDSVAAATRKPTTTTTPLHFQPDNSIQLMDSPLTAAEIIRKRRSGIDFLPGSSKMSQEIFDSILAATLPVPGKAPFDLWSFPAAINLLLFVHRVEGLQPGLYFLLRTQDDPDALAKHFLDSFYWDAISERLPLFCLQHGNLTHAAAQLSCGQDIAGNGSFSLGMLCRFADTLQATPYRYRQLFWEAGMIGQVLYLQAEAYGFRGTGIGCFFDDPVHEIAGLSGYTYQSIYHFTAGAPRDDDRLQNLPAYRHLKKPF